MSLSHEDLVAYAISGLDADEHARIETQLDDISRAELKEIEAHLAIHEQVSEIDAPASVWRGIEARLHEQPAPRSFIERFWMPLAAAALIVIAALFGQRSGINSPRDFRAVHTVHGSITSAPDGSYTASRVSRISLGRGVVVTLDADTTIQPLSNTRLALKAGRIFVSVSKGRRGFTVKTGELEVVTTGTAFLVEIAGANTRVAVVDGTVRCRIRGEEHVIAAGEEFNPAEVSGPRPTEWFTRLKLTARILAPNRIEVVISNDMPDTISKAPPTGGEPLFYATYGGRSVPLPTKRPAALISLAADTSMTFELSLPVPLKDGEALFIKSPALSLIAEAVR